MANKQVPGHAGITVNLVTMDRTYPVEVSPTSSVGNFKQRVRKVAAIPVSHRIRLIHAGRMLAEDQKTLAECQVINSSFVHCSSLDETAFAKVQPAGECSNCPPTAAYDGSGAGGSALYGADWLLSRCSLCLVSQTGGGRGWDLRTGAGAGSAGISRRASDLGAAEAGGPQRKCLDGALHTHGN